MSKASWNHVITTGVIVLVLALTACGGQDEADRAASDSASPGASTATNPYESAPEAERFPSKSDAELQSAREGVDANPTAGGYIDLSVLYYGSGKYRESIELCRKAIELDPANSIPYSNICSAHVKLGEFDEAIEACEKALEINPDYDRAKNNLAWARQMQGLAG